MTEETSFKKLKEWIINHTRLGITEIDSNVLNAKEKLGNAYIDLTISITDSGKYICTGYISYNGYDDGFTTVFQPVKIVNTEEEVINLIDKSVSISNKLMETVHQLGKELED